MDGHPVSLFRFLVPSGSLLCTDSVVTLFSGKTSLDMSNYYPKMNKRSKCHVYFVSHECPPRRPVSPSSNDAVSFVITIPPPCVVIVAFIA